MQLRVIKNGYIINLNRNETHQLKLSNKKCKKNQLLTVLHLAIHIISKLEIYRFGRKLKISIAKKGDNLKILIISKPQFCTSFAVKLQTEKELLTLTEQLYRNGCSKLCISSIYIFKDNYYLLITPITKSNKTKIICTEFCFKLIKNTSELTSLQQQGIEICSIDAIEKLGEAISK